MRVGTRASALALAQARLVVELLGGAGSGPVEIVEVTTSGDRGEGADKARWIDALERALHDGEIDLAVHSAKDVPGELDEGLELLGVLPRADASDALCGAPGLDALALGARVGTGSLRRIAQLRAAREDLEVVALAGNVDTRLRKLDEAEQRLDAIVLACAGLRRLGLEGRIDGTLDPARFVPAPGQGTLVLQGRAQDAAAAAAARAVTDPGAEMSLRAERGLARALDADCHTPLGAHAVAGAAGALQLVGWAGLPDGSAYVLDRAAGDAADPERLGAAVAERMEAAGARELLAQAAVTGTAAGG